MLDRTPLVRGLSFLMLAAGLTLLAGCGGGATGPRSQAWSAPRGLVASPQMESGSEDPGFQAWVMSRNENQMNPEPALPGYGRSWVEVYERDTVRTINGRPRDSYRRTTRSWEAGRRR